MKKDFYQKIHKKFYKLSKIILTKIILLSLVFASSSCSSKAQKFLPAVADRDLKDELKDTTNEYRAGWKDGCETGISGGANTFYKMFYRNNKIDGYLMASSPDYREAWEYSFWYCFRSTYIRNKSSIWGSIMKGFR